MASTTVASEGEGEGSVKLTRSLTAWSEGLYNTLERSSHQLSQHLHSIYPTRPIRQSVFATFSSLQVSHSLSVGHTLATSH